MSCQQLNELGQMLVLAFARQNLIANNDRAKGSLHFKKPEINSVNLKERPDIGQTRSNKKEASMKPPI